MAAKKDIQNTAKSKAAPESASANVGAESKPSGRMPLLSTNQKIALILAAVIIAIVLAMPLFAPPAAPEQQVDSQVFLANLQNSTSVGIFMDLRGVPDSEQQRKILQCGADMVSSLAISPELNGKRRLIGACNETSCMLADQFANTTQNASTSEVLYSMGKTVYFHIKGADEGVPIFYANRMEFPISKLANATCRVGASVSGTVINNGNSTVVNASAPKPASMPALNGSGSTGTNESGLQK